MFRFVGAATTVAVLLASADARADDWTSQGLDPAHHRATAERSGTTFRAESWTAAMSGGLWSTSGPAVADGILVLGVRDGSVRAMKASTGKPMWTFKTGDSVMASPAIHKGRVFVPSLDNTLYALRLIDGAVVWKKTLGGLEQSSPTVVGDSIIVAGGFPQRKVFRIDMLTGRTIWETSSEVMAQFSNAAAVSDETQIVVGALGGHYYSFDLATGAHRWTYEADGIVNLSAPVIVDGRAYLLPGGDSRRLHAVLLATGKSAVGWPVEITAPAVDATVPGKVLSRQHAVSSLAAAAGRLLFDIRFDESIDSNTDGVADRFLMREFVISASVVDGRELWRQGNGRRVVDSPNDMPKNWLCPTPVTFQNMGTGAASPLLAVPSTLQPTLTVFDVLGGTPRTGPTLAGPSRVSPVLANGRLLLGTDSGVVHAFLSSTNQPPAAPTLTGGTGRPVSSVAPVIHWTAAMDPNGDAVSYQVRVDHDAEILETWQTEITTGKGETSARLTQDLAPGLTHLVAVRARDANGAWSDWSTPQILRAVETPAVSVGGSVQPSLAAALAAARPGNVISLGAGTFYLTETMRVPAGVSVEGAGPQRTILDGTGQAAAVSLEGSVDGQPTTIKGLTVTGAQVGIAVRDTRDAQIKNVIVRDNWETGVEVSASGTAAMTNATLAANGRAVRSFGAITVKNSIVTGNQTGFVSDHADSIVSKFNDLFANPTAFSGMTRGDNDISGSVTFTNYARRDLRVLRAQASTDRGDPADDFSQEPPPNGGRINLGAFGGTEEAELSEAPTPPRDPSAQSAGGCAVAGDAGGAPGTAAFLTALGFAVGLLAFAMRPRRRRTVALRTRLHCDARRARMLVAALFLFSSAFWSTAAHALTCTWKAAGPANWNASTANWECGATDVIPDGDDDAVFNTTSTQTCTISAALNVNSIAIQSGAGTVLQATGGGIGITVDVNFTQAGGTFTGDDANIYIGGSLALSSGTFTSTGGILEIVGAFNKTNGTFNANGGRVQLSSLSDQTLASNSATFNYLYVTDGLVRYFKLDENGGTTPGNSMAHFHSYNLVNTPTWATSSGPSLDYRDVSYLTFAAASSEYGSIASDANVQFDASESYSLSVWVNPTAGSGTGQLGSAGYKGVVTFSRDQANYWGLWIEPTNGRWFNACAGAAYGSTATAGWHHVALVQTGSGSGDRRYVYIDGSDVTSGTPTACDSSGVGTMVIGGSYFSGSHQEFFSGSIDEIRVYKRALSTTEISALATGGQPTTSVATQTLTGSPTAARVVVGGGFNIGTGTIHATGDWFNYGGAVSGSGTVSLEATSGTKYIRTNRQSFADLTFNGSGATWEIEESDLTVTGDLAIQAGTFTAPTGLLKVSGAFNKTGGTFTHNSGRVLLDSPTSQTFASNGATFNNLTINDGLLAYWKLDDTASPSVDSSGYGLDATWASSPVASATVPTVNFSDTKSLGIDSASDTASFSSPDAPVITIAAWIRATGDGGSANGRIVHMPGYMFLLRGSTGVAPDNKMALGFTSDRSTDGEWRSPVDSLTYGSWYHVAVTYDSSNTANNSVFYINGALVATTNKVAPPVGSQDSNVGTGYIGNRSALDRYFNGLIDELRIYNRVLSASEINSLYIGNLPGSAAATHTLTGNPIIAGDLVIASGGLAAGTTSITVGGSWWNYGGLFTAGSTGLVTFNGSGTNQILSAGQMFGGITLNGSGTWTLNDRTEFNPASTFTATAGTIDLSTRVLRGGNLDRTSATITASTSTVVFDASSNKTVEPGSLYNVQFEPVTATDLVGYWKLDEGQGTTARDYSASATNGTLTNGPKWTDSSLASAIQFENPAALEFDGTDDYVAVPTTAFNTSVPYSVCAWVNMDSMAGSEYHYFVGKSGAAGSAFFLQYRDDTNSFAFTVANTDNGASQRADGTSDPVIDTWYHLCGVYDNASAYIYVNGVFEDSTVITADYNATGSVTIGAAQVSSSLTNYTDGTIDDVRIYDVALTAAQVKALATGTYPAGLTGTPTYTLGVNSTVTGTFKQHNGTLATSTYTMNPSAAGNVATVYSGTYSVGSATSTFTGGLTVNLPGTLDLPSTGTVSIASGKILTIDGTLSASDANATIQSVSGTYTFKVGSTSTSTPTVNITGLKVKNTNTDGMYINAVVGSTTTFTRFDNIAFSLGTGAQLLQIYAPTLYLFSNGCTFDTGVSATTTYSVTLTGDNSSATETRAMFGDATCASNKASCEAYDNDDDSGLDGLGDTPGSNDSVIQWVHSASSDVNGTIEGFPTAAFDWNLFTYYSTYVTYHDVDGGTADKIYVRDTDGNTAGLTYSFTGPSGEDFVGTPRFDTVSNIHYVYVATSAGKVYRLVDNTGSDTLAPDTDAPWSGTAYDCSCTITTPLTIDSTNVYWGGTQSSNNKVWTLGKTTKALAASSPFTVTAVISGAAPTVWVSGSTYIFMGSAGHFYKVNISTQTLTTDNASPGSATVNGRISLINSKVHGADSAGWLWVLDPTTFSTTLWSYHDNANHSGCTSGACAIQSPLYVDWQTTNVYYGDSDGHLYASYNSTGTTGAQRTGFPFRPGTSSDVFASAPFFDANKLVAGTTTGNLYVINTTSGSPVLEQTYKFGTANAVSGVGYDKGSGTYMISTSNATSKDGKLIYIDD